MEVAFPIKGVNRVTPHSAQPEGTTYDALNVLPFDRHGRLRGGSRTGIGKLYATALNTDQAVTGMMQTERPVDPDTITADTLQLTKTFTGLGTGNLSDLDTDFTSHIHSGSCIDDATSAGNVLVSASGAYAPTSAVTNRAAVYSPSLVLGTSYVLKATIRFNTNGTGAGIVARVDKTKLAGAQDAPNITLTLSKTQVSLTRSTAACGASTTDTFAISPSLQAGVDYLLELRVNGDEIEGYLDGVLKVSGTITDPSSSNVGVGLFFDGTASVNGETWVRSLDVYTGRNLTSYVESQIIYTSGQNVYVGDVDSAALANNGSAVLSDQVRPEMTYSAGYAYIVDGASILKLNLATRDVETYTATAGTAPASCTLAAMWRDRLVLAAPEGDPQNFFFSRVGTHTDWDYSQTDPAAAFAGNASTAGRIGEPIRALIPFSDDVLLIMGSTNIWQVRGDPADGGSIDLVSDNVGILGPQAWAKAPDGSVYFVGPGGFYRIVPDGKPENISRESYPQFFTAIDPDQNWITGAWDKDRQGMWVFVTSVNSAESTHIWYDARTGGFFPQQFSDDHGPISALVLDGGDADERFLMLGGRDGYVRAMNSTNKTDDGDTIHSTITLGPWKFGKERTDATVIGLDFTLGELADGDDSSAWSVVWKLQAGDTARDAVANPRRFAGGDFPAGGRQVSRRPRVRGQWFALKLTNDVASNYWSLESVDLQVVQGGKTRR